MMSFYIYPQINKFNYFRPSRATVTLFSNISIQINISCPPSRDTVPLYPNINISQYFLSPISRYCPFISQYQYISIFPVAKAIYLDAIYIYSFLCKTIHYILHENQIGNRKTALLNTEHCTHTKNLRILWLMRK